MIDFIKTIRHSRILRFFVVGCMNAALHFSVLNFSFYVLQQNKIVSSILATICAVGFSFVLNRNFVFADKNTRPTKQLLMFVLVTVAGMLIIHNTVYSLTLIALQQWWDQDIVSLIHTLTGITLTKDFVDINASTVIGAIVTMIWNYNAYRLWVFKRKELYEEDPEAA